MANAFGLSDVRRQLEEFRDRLSGFGLDPQTAERLQRYIESRLRDLAQMMKQVVRQELEKQDLARRESQRMQTLSEKSFFYLSEDEIRRMKEAVTRLAQRLKNVIAIKRKRGQARASFDVKDTFRKNLQYGGVPFHIQFDDKKKDKPQVVILCDVSDSVRNVSRFMLQFVYSPAGPLLARPELHLRRRDRARSRRLFEEHDIHEAIELALHGNIINVFAHSDFGRAFKMFHRDYITAVNKRTTVIVLGDARNNYNLPHEWVLRDIRRRAKQLIWLNPESKMTWGFGDSEMDRYLPFCDVIEECRNLNQLYRVIDRLVAHERAPAEIDKPADLPGE